MTTLQPDSPALNRVLVVWLGTTAPPPAGKQTPEKEAFVVGHLLYPDDLIQTLVRVNA